MPYQEHSIPRLVLLFFLSDQSYHPQYYISGYFDLFQTKFLSINGWFFFTRQIQVSIHVPRNMPKTIKIYIYAFIHFNTYKSNEKIQRHIFNLILKINKFQSHTLQL